MESLRSRMEVRRQILGLGPVNMERAVTRSDAPHKCGSCSEGNPCGTCGGNVDPQSPAFQALSWGMTINEQVLDPFWRAAAIGESVRLATAGDSDPSATAINSMIWRSQQAFTLISQGANASSLAASLPHRSMLSGVDYFAAEGSGGPVTTGEPKPETPLPTSPPPSVPLVPVTEPPPYRGREEECCPILVYPVPDPIPDFEVYPDGSVNFFHEFTAYAIYLEGEHDGRLCSCKCCIFRQHLDRDVTVTALGPPSSVVFSGTTKSGLDRDDNKTPEYPKGVPFGEVKRPRPAGTPSPNKSCYGPHGVSCEDVTHSGTTDPAKAQRIQQIRDKHKDLKGSFCLYEMKDRPGVVVKPGFAKAAQDCFTGVVLDTCHDCTPATDPQSFTLNVSGAVSADGKTVSGTGVGKGGKTGKHDNTPVKPPRPPSCKSKPAATDCAQS